MPDLDSTLGELAELGRRPPSQTPDLASVAARARGVRRRRRVVSASPVVILVVALAALAVWGDRDRGEGSVAVEPPTTTAVHEEVAPEEVEPLRVVPATELVDGSMVEIELLEDPGEPLVAVQCASAVRSEMGAEGRCNDSVSTVRSGTSGPLDAVRVTRYQFRAMGGPYDCAQRAWRCYLVVAPGTPTDVDFERAVSVPIWFVEDGRGASVVVSDSEPANGDVITISGSGLPWDTQLSVLQCQPGESFPDLRCDSLRGKSVTTDAEGRFETRFQVSEVIRLWSEWSEDPCRSCVIRVTAGQHLSAQVDIEVRPNLEPVRPQFEIVEEGPFTPGQPVTVIGRGFQIELENDYEKPYPEWCILGPDPPVCGGPGEPFERVETGPGEYRYEGFLMPHGLFGERCLTEACVVTWIRGEGTPPAAIANFSLVPE